MTVHTRSGRGAARCDRGGASSAAGAGARAAPRADPAGRGAPGSVSSLLQQAGRAGRREQPSASIYVAFDGPTDQFFFRHPDRLFGRPVEAAMIDAENAQLLGQHLACAAVELPLLLGADQAYFGARVPDVAAELRGAGARRSRRRWRVCPACGVRCGSAAGRRLFRRCVHVRSSLTLLALTARLAQERLCKRGRRDGVVSVVTPARRRCAPGVLSRHPHMPASAGALLYVGTADNPAAAFSLRAIDPERYAIVNEAADGMVIEEIEESKAFFEVYDGAVYLYQGRTYLCKKLDLGGRVATVRPADLKYYTKTRDFTDVHVLGLRAAYEHQARRATGAADRRRGFALSLSGPRAASDLTACGCQVCGFAGSRSDQAGDDRRARMATCRPRPRRQGVPARRMRTGHAGAAPTARAALHGAGGLREGHQRHGDHGGGRRLPGHHALAGLPPRVAGLGRGVRHGGPLPAQRAAAHAGAGPPRTRAGL